MNSQISNRELQFPPHCNGGLRRYVAFQVTKSQQRTEQSIHLPKTIARGDEIVDADESSVYEKVGAWKVKREEVEAASADADESSVYEKIGAW